MIVGMSDATGATPNLPEPPAPTPTPVSPEVLAARAGIRLVTDPNAEGIHLKDDGTVVIRFLPPGVPDGDMFEVRCPPPTLDGYELIVNAIEDARDEVAQMRAGNDAFRERIAALGGPVDPETGKQMDPERGTEAYRELLTIRREFDRKDNADQVRIRRLGEQLIKTAVANSTDDGKGGGTVLPDRLPVWLSTWGNVDVLMAHWERTPFLGPAGRATR